MLSCSNSELSLLHLFLASNNRQKKAKLQIHPDSRIQNMTRTVSKRKNPAWEMCYNPNENIHQSVAAIHSSKLNVDSEMKLLNYLKRISIWNE